MRRGLSALVIDGRFTVIVMICLILKEDELVFSYLLLGRVTMLPLS